MWEVVSLGATLFIIATVFPPYNVFIAQSISERNLFLYLSTMIPALSGLLLGGILLGYGTKFLGLPLELIGGIFIIIVGLRMLLFKKNPAGESHQEDQLKQKVSGSAQAAISCFLISVMPGVFTVSMATGFNTLNYGQISAVFMGAALGTNLGGILLFKGAKLAHLPLDKLGGVLLLFVGFLTIK